MAKHSLSVGHESVQFAPESNLALAVMERAVRDYSRNGAWAVDARIFLFSEKARAHRLWWCEMISDAPDRVEFLIQEWARHACTGKERRNRKMAATRRKYG